MKKYTITYTFLALAIAGSLLVGAYKSPKLFQYDGGLQVRKTSAVELQPWEDIGPNNFGGRTSAIAIHPTTGHVYVGSTGGGLWTSSDNGFSWNRVQGFNDNLVVSHILIDEDKFYVSTGDLVRNAKIRSGTNSNFNNNNIGNFPNGYFGYSGMPGKGVYISTDGGQTFSNENATWDSACDSPNNPCFYDVNNNPFASVQKIIKADNKFYIATYKGLYFTDDNFTTVNKATLIDTSGNDRSDQPIIDLEVSGTKVYAASVGNPANVFVQDNFTGNFASINNKISDMFASNNRPVRFEIAISPTDPNYVYIGVILNIAKLGFGGVTMSSDGGNTFSKIAPPSVPGVFTPTSDGNGWYSFCMTVDPKNPKRLLVGGTGYWEYDDVNGWSNPGTSFLPFIGYDQYVGSALTNIIFNPFYQNQQIWYTGSREIVLSNTDGKSFEVRSKGYNTAHATSVKFGEANDVYGTVRELGYVYKNNPSKDFQEFVNLRRATDGRIVCSNINPNYILASGVSGDVLSRSTNAGNLFENFYGYPQECTSGGSPDEIPSGPAGEPSVPAIFVMDETPISTPTIDSQGAHYQVQDTNGTKYYKTYAYAHDYNHEHIWCVSNPFGGSDSLPKWNKISLNGPINEGEGDDRVTAMAVSKDGNHTLYVATRKGRIWRIKNANDICNPIAEKISGSLPSRWITSLTVHPDDANTLLVTYGSYDITNISAGRIYVSNDAMSANPTFRDVTDNFPKYPVYTALFAPSSTLPTQRTWKVLIGTEVGVYASNEDLTNPSVSLPDWKEANNGSMSKVPVVAMDMKVWNRRVVTNGSATEIWLDESLEKNVVIATLGKGMFISKDWTVGTQNPTSNLYTLSASLYPNPASHSTNIKVELPLDSAIELVLTDVSGKIIENHQHKMMHSGTHLFELNTEHLPQGIYFVKVKASQYSKTLKLQVSH